MYNIFSRKRILGFWSKDFRLEDWYYDVGPGNYKQKKISIDYSFNSEMPYEQITNTVGLIFIQDTNEPGIGKRSTHTVVSMNFTEEQLVEFIMEAEKALRSIQNG